MKFNKITTLIFTLIIIYCNTHNSESEKNPVENNTLEYKTFLVKTNMEKEDLQALLQEGEAQLMNLKKNKTQKKKYFCNY